MSGDQMLDTLKSLISETEKPVLVSFRRKRKNNKPFSPFMEVIESEYQGKLRSFELDYSQSDDIYEHFQLPKTETAVIFEDGKNSKTLHGHKNVRKYLRTLFQKN